MAGGDDRGAAAAADADDGVEVGRVGSQAAKRLGHGGDGGAAVVGLGDGGGGDVGGDRSGARVPTSTISGAPPASRMRCGEEGELLALGVRSADDVDLAHVARTDCRRREGALSRAVGFLPVGRSGPAFFLRFTRRSEPARKRDCFRFETTVSY